MSDELLYSLKNSVAQIVINRPEARNSLNQALLVELGQTIKRALSDDNVRAIMLSGQGTQAFCAGADLRELQKTISIEEKRALFGGLGLVLTQMHASTKPFIAKVHGHCLAGGCGLAAACDIVVASDKAKFGLPEIKLGLVPMVVMLPIERMIGKRALAELVLTGEIIDANYAKQIGLITKIVPEAELDQKATALAETLAKWSQPALAAARKALYDAGESDYSKQMLDFAGRISQLSLGKDVQEGISAFFEKRPAKWS